MTCFPASGDQASGMRARNAKAPKGRCSLSCRVPALKKDYTDKMHTCWSLAERSANKYLAGSATEISKGGSHSEESSKSTFKI